MTHGLRARCSSPFTLIHPRIWEGGAKKVWGCGESLTGFVGEGSPMETRPVLRAADVAA